MPCARKFRNAVVVFSAVIWLAACQTTADPPPNLERGADGTASIVLIEPQIEAGLMTAGGVFESRADWTESVYTNVLAALKSEGAKRNLNLDALKIDSLPIEDQKGVEAVRRIHKRVARAKSLHQETPGFNLPTRGKRYQAKLGKKDLEPISKLTDKRYAVMLSIQDSYTSGGRAAAIFAAAILFGAHMQGGQTIGHYSLVDLKTGIIIWQTRVPVQSELRTPEGAKKMVATVLDAMQGKASVF